MDTGGALISVATKVYAVKSASGPFDNASSMIKGKDRDGIKYK